LLRTCLIVASSLVSAVLTIPRVCVAQQRQSFGGIVVGGTLVPQVPATPQQDPLCLQFVHHTDAFPGITVGLIDERELRQHWTWEAEAAFTEIPASGDSYLPGTPGGASCPMRFPSDKSLIVSLLLAPRFYLRPQNLGFFVTAVAGDRWFVVDPEHLGGHMYPAIGLGVGLQIPQPNRVALEARYERLAGNLRAPWMVPLTIGWEW
jgi:hypothetical protein